MRNDPCSPKAVSTLSAYLHFGHISGQRVALEASKHRKEYKVGCLYTWQSHWFEVTYLSCDMEGCMCHTEAFISAVLTKHLLQSSYLIADHGIFKQMNEGS